MADERKTTDRDAFWDLSALLPAKPTARRVSAQREDTEPVMIERHIRTGNADAIGDALFEEHPVSPYATKEERRREPLFSYTPTASLLREVRVYPWRTQYDYYEAFRAHALRFLHKKGEESPAVEFFSYMPQYTQMNEGQLRYYLWWREEFRRGNPLPASFSYLLLYLYELINLGDAIPPIEGQACMLRLWTSYREAHPRLDSLVREWLCDYSLLHRLPPPVLPQKQFRSMLSGCALKEFYVAVDENVDALGSAMLAFCNNYDYTKSKFYTPETAADYHRVLRGAVRVALAQLRGREDGAMWGKGSISTITRDAFTGAICSYRARRRIEVDYTSFSHTHELRYVMSDVLKYAENGLRASLGIKSRLSIYALDVPLRTALDAYLQEALPKRQSRASKSAEQPPEYERRYELPHTAPSPERAARIEAESWQTTKRLVEAFEGERTEEIPPRDTVSPPPPPPMEPPQPDAAGGLRAALGVLVDFLALLDKKDAAALRAFAAGRGMMIDAVVDKINTVAGDMLGDILIEEVDGALVIIEDYREDLIKEGVLEHGE